MPEETTYRYGPLERGGVMLGLRLPQLVGFVIAGVIGLIFLNRVGGFGGLLLAIATLAAAAGVLIVQVRGHTIEEWTPLTVRFLVGRLSGKARFRAQLAKVGHVVRVPDGGLQPEQPDDPKSIPAELAAIEFLECELARYQGALMGVAVDRTAKTFTATMRCQGQAFALLGAEERQQRLGDYGGVLAALARDDTPLRRVAWIERTLPANGDAMTNYLYENKRPDASLEEPAARAGVLLSAARALPRCRRGPRAACSACRSTRAARRPSARSSGSGAVISAPSPCSPRRSGRSPICSTPPGSRSPAC